MPSGPIVYQLGGGAVPAFAQQGQVDWVAFGNTAWSITSSLLQRFSGADVQPATFGAGLALGCRFTLGLQAQRRVERILSSLQGRGSYQDLLWFGFGHRSFVNLITSTHVGLQCAALCGCLADTHSIDVAGFILQDLWKACDFPDQYEPSHEQFAKLIKACQGIFASSTFGETLDRMLGDGWVKVCRSQDHPQSQTWDRCAKAWDIAIVLRALFDISNGRVESITVAGAGECAFIGALAEWLFDLSVCVEGIYDGTPDGQRPHVIIKYLRDQSDVDQSLASLESTAYYLENTSDFWSQLSHAEDSPAVLVLKTSWATCLSATFGNYFGELCKASFTLAEYLGSAARIYSALALGQPDIGELEDARAAFIDFLDGCHGPGLISTIMCTFPELEQVPDLTEWMYAAEAKPLPEALMLFQTSVNMLQKNCTCVGCSPRGPKSNRGRTCLTQIAYSILQIARSLACVEYDRTLPPTSTGIRWIQVNAPSPPANKTAMTKDILFDLLNLHKRSVDRLFSLPGYIFSGRSLTVYDGGAIPSGAFGGESGLCAASSSGICYYIDGLRQLSSSPDYARIVHVVSGHIQHNLRRYDAVLDLHADQISFPNAPSSLLAKHFSSYNMRDGFPREESRKELRAVVLEKAGTRTLNFTYKVSLPLSGTGKRVPLPPLNLPPGFLSRTILGATGLLFCARGIGECPTESVLRVQSVPESRRIVDYEVESELDFDGSVACCMSTPSQDEIDHCVAIVLFSHKVGNRELYIRRGECLPCCAQAVVKRYRPALRYSNQKAIVQIIDTE